MSHRFHSLQYTLIVLIAVGFLFGYRVPTAKAYYEVQCSVVATYQGGNTIHVGWSGQITNDNNDPDSAFIQSAYFYVDGSLWYEDANGTADFVLGPGYHQFDLQVNGSNNYVDKGCSASDGATIPASPVLGCTDPNALNYNPSATANDGSCVYPIYGCTDPNAINYNPNANTNDGSCTYPPPTVYGCTDPNALNYNSSATANDGSCVYPIYGCTDPSATNYNPNANRDNGSCVARVYGCTNSGASNYNPSANTDNGSCTYPPMTGTINVSSNNQSAAYYIQRPDGNTFGWNGSHTFTDQEAGGYSISPDAVPAYSVAVSPGSQTLSGGGTIGWTITYTPACASGYGNACTGPASSANACGQTNGGGPGTTQCDGSCSGSQGSTPANPAGYGNACSSAPNACGMTNIGATQCDGSCSAAPPAPNLCPAPTVSGVTSTNPDYCLSGPGGYVLWSYSDPNNSPQTAYEVQIATSGNFNSPVYDSGELLATSRTSAIPTGTLQFNKTYSARVRAWNTYTALSAWSSPTNSWTTPPYAYPDVISPYQFTWPNPPRPQQNKPLPFTDHTVFGAGGNHTWSWNFGDGGTSTQQNPSHTYTAIGNFAISETVTDAAGQTCSNSQSLNIQKPIPVIIEVAPK